MADEKSKNLTGADGPGKDPAQPGAGGSPAPGKEQKEPEAAAPAKEEKKPEIPKEQKAETPEGKEAPNVSFYNFSEIMAGKKEAQKAPPGQDGKAPGKAAPTSPEKETAKGTKEAPPGGRADRLLEAVRPPRLQEPPVPGPQRRGNAGYGLQRQGQGRHPARHCKAP